MDMLTQQIAGILATNDYPFEVVDDSTLAVPGDSIIVRITVDPTPPPLVGMRAVLLRGMDVTPDSRAAILARINEENDKWLTPKFVFYPQSATITLEYDFFANELREESFLDALAVCGGRAERLDDELKEAFGGRRARETADEDQDALFRQLMAETPPLEPEPAPTRQGLFRRRR